MIVGSIENFPCSSTPVFFLPSFPITMSAVIDDHLQCNTSSLSRWTYLALIAVDLAMTYVPGFQHFALPFVNFMSQFQSRRRRKNFFAQTKFFSFFLLSANGLRLLDIHLPSIAFYGQAVQLNCTYELEFDQLYSIKWYRDDDEFYRYLPSNFPTEQFYRTRGLYVDVSANE